MARPRAVEVEVRRRDGETVVVPAGELDVARAPAVRDALAGALTGSAGPVVVDLSRVTFLDSTGLAALLNAARRLRRAGRDFAVVGARGPVRDVIRLAHLEADLGCAD